MRTARWRCQKQYDDSPLLSPSSQTKPTSHFPPTSVAHPPSASAQMPIPSLQKQNPSSTSFHISTPNAPIHSGNPEKYQSGSQTPSRKHSLLPLSRAIALLHLLKISAPCSHLPASHTPSTDTFSSSNPPTVPSSPSSPPPSSQLANSPATPSPHKRASQNTTMNSSQAQKTLLHILHVLASRTNDSWNG